jgi:hypothetical protein
MTNWKGSERKRSLLWVLSRNLSGQNEFSENCTKNIRNFQMLESDFMKNYEDEIRCAGEGHQQFN